MASDEGVSYCRIVLFSGDEYALTMESQQILHGAIYEVPEFEEGPKFVTLNCVDGNTLNVRVDAIVCYIDSTPVTRKANMKNNYIMDREREKHAKQVQEEVISQDRGPQIHH